MKSTNHGFQSGEEGKGTVGCVVSIVLMVIAIFLGLKLGPVYYNHYNLKGDFDQEVSRAAVRGAGQKDAIIQGMLRIAKNNSIALEEKNVKVDFGAGQLKITIEYSVPVNFLIMKRDLNFKLEGKSFTAG